MTERGLIDIFNVTMMHLIKPIWLLTVPDSMRGRDCGAPRSTNLTLEDRNTVISVMKSSD